MRIGFVVNDIFTEQPGYTTTHLALAASQMGHEVWHVSVADFRYLRDEFVHVYAAGVACSHHRTTRTYIQDLQSDQAKRQEINLRDFDVLMLRNDPAEDVRVRPWARLAGINFARFAVRHGVMVLNDPAGLNRAVNKLYLQEFPAEVRPQAIICRDPGRIKQFAKEMGGTVVLKPLAGSGGRNVFLLRPEDMANMNQIIETVSRDDYVIAQEYLPAAVNGDTRVFMLNGQPLRSKDRYALIQRLRSDGDMRSNMSAGADAAPAQMTDEILELAETIRPQLLHDGMFFVGLDVVGNKLMEINVFSPGGLESAERFTGIKFSRLVIRDLERKLEHRNNTDRHFSNAELAVI